MTPTEKAVEAMARATYEHTNDEVSWAAVIEMATAGETFAIGQVDFVRNEMGAALAALLTLYPGIKGLIEGTHTAVPVEPTEAAIDAGAEKVRQKYLSSKATAYHVYRAMLAAAEKEKGG